MHHSLAYDIIVNFVDAHEQAINMILNVIENKQYVEKIIHESKDNTDEAEKYMHEEIELNFPEVAKAIQMRRASYYLLMHEYQYVDHMLKKGQIEEKEAN